MTVPALDPAALGVTGALPGHVYLVGAGPGDPGLLTIRAATLIATADVIAYDRLAPPQALELAPVTARRVCVGKTIDQPGWAQEDTNALLVAEAQAGRAVVRVKGGDPYVFGRGGEEALACRAAGIPVEVVSGVTAAVAAPAAAGIPVTHRGLATGVAVVTGHETPTKDADQLDWEALARFHGTLVFLMGVGNAGRIAGMLLTHGRAPETPAAVIRWGTTGAQETLTTTLVRLADDIRRHGLRSPATIVVGDVVALRATLADGQTDLADLPRALDPHVAPTEPGARARTSPEPAASD